MDCNHKRIQAKDPMCGQFLERRFLPVATSFLFHSHACKTQMMQQYLHLCGIYKYLDLSFEEMHFGYSTSSSNCSRKPWQSNFLRCSTSHSKRPDVVATTPNLHLQGSNTRTIVDCMLVRTKMSITIKGGINDIPQPKIIRCMISILRLFSFSIVLFKHSNACIHQPCEVGNKPA
jgi:hypothetical protein